MAIAFRAATTAALAGTSSAVVSLPTGTQNGDYLLLGVVLGFGNTATVSGSWMLVGNVSTPGNLSGYLFKTIADNEPASYTVTANGNTDGSVAVVGYVGPSAFSASGKVTGSNSTISPNAPALSGMGPHDASVIMYGSINNTANSSANIAPPATPWTTRALVNDGQGLSAIAFVDDIGGSGTPNATQTQLSDWAVFSQALAAPSGATGNFLPLMGRL